MSLKIVSRKPYKFNFHTGIFKKGRFCVRAFIGVGEEPLRGKVVHPFCEKMKVRADALRSDAGGDLHIIKQISVRRANAPECHNNCDQDSQKNCY